MRKSEPTSFVNHPAQSSLSHSSPAPSISLLPPPPPLCLSVSLSPSLPPLSLYLPLSHLPPSISRPLSVSVSVSLFPALSVSLPPISLSLSLSLSSDLSQGPVTYTFFILQTCQRGTSSWRSIVWLGLLTASEPRTGRHSGLL